MLEQITLFYLKSQNRKLIEKKEFNLPNNTTIEAYIFEKENEVLLGQALPFSKIILTRHEKQPPFNFPHKVMDLG